MTFFKRIFFFLLVNFAIIAVLMTITSIFGIEPYLQPYGLNLTSLAIYAAIIGFTGSFISLFLSKWMAKKMMGVQVIETPSNTHEAKLTEIVSHVAQQIGIKMPEVGIYNSKEVNAFATGWSKNHSLIAVSAGLLEQMTDDEVEGVLAHEMAHVANGDMVTMTLLQGVLNTFVIFAARALAFVIQRLMGRDSDEIGGLAYWGISILLEIVFSILATMVVMWFSRWREFHADMGGAKFVGKSKMISALKKLKTLSNRVDPAHKSMATMKISDRPSLLKLFASHPPLDKRIEALQKAMIS
jgi:heat shock protein HtpX